MIAQTVVQIIVDIRPTVLIYRIVLNSVNMMTYRHTDKTRRHVYKIKHTKDKAHSVSRIEEKVIKKSSDRSSDCHQKNSKFSRLRLSFA